MFSKSGEYGIKAAIYIAKQTLKDNKVSLKDIAKAIDSPEAYTSKILQKLKKNNIVISEKGPKGGFSMNKLDIDKIMLSTVVYAIDGDVLFKRCGLGFDLCSDKNPCPFHNQYKVIRSDMKKMIETTSITSLVSDLKVGKTVLKGN